VAVASSGNNLYVIAGGNLAISNDGGNSFRSATGIGGTPYCIFADGANLYVGTSIGMYISNNSGASFPIIANQGHPFYVVYESGGTAYGVSNTGLVTTNVTVNGVSSTTKPILDNTYGANGILLNNGILYISTSRGLLISTDGGTTYALKNSTQLGSLSNNTTAGLGAIGNKVFVATGGGISSTTDGGNTFTNNFSPGQSYGLTTNGNTVYLATFNYGLGVSTDGGTTFSYVKTTSGLGSNNVYSISVSGSTVYVGTSSGLNRSY
jgi:hypothetical protein